MCQHSEEPRLPHERGLAAHVGTSQQQQAGVFCAQLCVVRDEVLQVRYAGVTAFYYVYVRLKKRAIFY